MHGKIEFVKLDLNQYTHSALSTIIMHTFLPLSSQITCWNLWHASNHIYPLKGPLCGAVLF